MGVSLIWACLLVGLVPLSEGACIFPTSMAASWWQKYNGADRIIQRFDSATSKIYIESISNIGTATPIETYECMDIYDNNHEMVYIRKNASSSPECVSSFVTPTTQNTYVQQVAPIPSNAVATLTKAQDCLIYLANATEHEFFIQYPFNFTKDSCSIPEGTYDITYKRTATEGVQCMNNPASIAKVTKTHIILETCVNENTYEKPLFTTLNCVDHISTTSLRYPATNGKVVILGKGSTKREFYCGKITSDPPNSKLYLSLLINTAGGVECAADHNSKSFDVASGTNYIAYELTLNHCISRPCQNGANCTSMWNGYQCSCVPGYTGVNCETNFDECGSMPCQNGATCKDLINEYQCICPPDYTGTHCEQELCTYPNEWQSSGPFFQKYTTTTMNLMNFSKIDIKLFTPSRTNAIALCTSNSTVDQFTYSVVGYDLKIATFTKKFTYCYENRFISPFMLFREKNTAPATTVLSSACPAEFGARLSTRVLIKHPFNFSAGSCPFPVAEYQFTYSDENTTNACDGDDNSTLTTSIKSLTASSCFAGTPAYDQPFSGTFECIGRVPASAIDTSPGFSDALILTRKDSAGNYRFYCARWKVVDTVVMLSVDVTNENELICAANAPHDRSGGATVGPDTYKYVSFNLTSKECNKQPCQNGGTCNQGLASYNCTCALGYEGKHCETDTNECASTPCQNGGTCNDMINMYNCTCPNGFVGTHCETPDHCWSSPCQQGGTCAPNAGNTDYVCTCPRGYDGKNCDNNINECASNPCKNTGTCTDLVDGYNCTCPVGVGGVHCEDDIDECKSDPCQNGGTCHDRYNGYLCVCTNKFKGTHCESINECHSNPCQNGGLCIDDLFHYKCNCTKGYSGVNCEINENDCASDPCQNGASCEDGLDSYKCYCPLGYIGTNCQIDVDECASSPCLRGKCEDLIGRFRCTCPSGYSGIFCQERQARLETDLITIIILSIFGVVTFAVIVIALIALYYRRRRRLAKERFFANGDHVVSQHGSVKSSVKSWIPDYRNKDTLPQ